MAITEVDRKLLVRVLSNAPGAWKDFVDRYAGLATHVLDHLQESWSITLTREARAEVFHDVFQAIRDDDLKLLRQHDGNSSLATYLTVAIRRVAGQKLLEMRESL